MKTKLIPHNNYLLLVDTDSRSVGYQIHVKEDGTLRFMGVTSWTEGYLHVIAHLPPDGAPRMEGVMLMPELPTQTDYVQIKTIAQAEADKTLGPSLTGTAWWGYRVAGFVAGYKAAPQKKYSEEDVRKAAANAVTKWFNQKEFPHTGGILWDMLLTELKSPVPVLPTGFEPEINWTKPCSDGKCHEVELTKVEDICADGCVHSQPVYRTLLNDQRLPVLQGAWIY